MASRRAEEFESTFIGLFAAPYLVWSAFPTTAFSGLGMGRDGQTRENPTHFPSEDGSSVSPESCARLAGPC